MKFYIGNTDFKWYSYLSKIQPDDVNFWQPGGKTPFKVLEPGGPFLFKLKHPYNAISGVGFFSSHTFLPLTIAWDVFQQRNGCDLFKELRSMISSYRSEWWDANPMIGCIVLTNPLFFEEGDWIPVPENWSKSIVQGKSYSTEDAVGRNLWSQVEELIQKYLASNPKEEGKSQLILESTGTPGYKDILTRVRLGQGAFRVLITDAYSRKCCVTGESTLPVLEAAHIKPYALSGPHFISNGILLRSDLHKLFDQGYLTITKDYNIEISTRIKEEFHNGKEYYKYQGTLLTFPPLDRDRPNPAFIEWHQSNVYKG